MAIRQDELDNWFSYHTAEGDDVGRLQAIRAAGRAFAQTILNNTPPSADQTTAVRKVREAVMTANAAVVCKGH